MKFLLLPVFFLMCSPAFSITLEECQSYTNDFLKKNVTESETDEVYPYRLKTIDVLAGFDTNKLGLELNHSILEKWRASCVNKPDMSVPVCDNVFPVQCERKPEHAERTGCFERNGKRETSRHIESG